MRTISSFVQRNGTRGHSFKLYKRRSRLNICTDAFFNYDLNLTVVSAPSLNTFKSRLNQYQHGYDLNFSPASFTLGQP